MKRALPLLGALMLVTFLVGLVLLFAVCWGVSVAPFDWRLTWLPR